MRINVILKKINIQFIRYKLFKRINLFTDGIIDVVINYKVLTNCTKVKKKERNIYIYIPNCHIVYKYNIIIIVTYFI